MIAPHFRLGHRGVVLAHPRLHLKRAPPTYLLAVRAHNHPRPCLLPHGRRDKLDGRAQLLHARKTSYQRQADESGVVLARLPPEVLALAKVLVGEVEGSPGEAPPPPSPRRLSTARPFGAGPAGRPPVSRTPPPPSPLLWFHRGCACSCSQTLLVGTQLPPPSRHVRAAAIAGLPLPLRGGARTFGLMPRVRRTLLRTPDTHSSHASCTTGSKRRSQRKGVQVEHNKQPCVPGPDGQDKEAALRARRAAQPPPRPHAANVSPARRK